jgi:adenylate kinase
LRLALLGAPGSGKGTQAKLLEGCFGWPQISTGDIFRREISAGTEIGKEAAGYIDQGRLVPDEIVNAIVRKRVAADDLKNGFVLDGYPRTVPQAEALDASGMGPELVVQLSIDKDELIARIGGRLTCSLCGSMFHATAHPSRVAGVCDRCRGSLKRREDDGPETVRTRLEVYERQTAPLVGYYDRKGVLEVLKSGTAGPEEVFQELASLLKRRAPRVTWQKKKA